MAARDTAAWFTLRSVPKSPWSNDRQGEDQDGSRQLPRWMFETRTEDWHEAGLAEEISHVSVRRPLLQALLYGLLFAAVLLAYDNRQELLEADQNLVRGVTAVLLASFGWGLARATGKGLIPTILRRLAPATAGSVGFTIRLVMTVVVGVVALRVAGIRAETLVLGGAFTFVVVGLAAQQTLGNVFAGIVLQGTRPFRVGERVRVTGGPISAPLEGTVGSLGLFYTALVTGSERVMVPNSALLQASVTPLREPDRVDLRARFSSRVSPSALQEKMRERVNVPTLRPPQIMIEEIERDDVVLRITATPADPADAVRLSEEILGVTRDRFTEARVEAGEGDPSPRRG